MSNFVRAVKCDTNVVGDPVNRDHMDMNASLDTPLEELVAGLKTRTDVLRAISEHATASALPKANMTALRSRLNRLREVLCGGFSTKSKGRGFDLISPRRFVKEVVRCGSWVHPLSEEEVVFDQEYLTRIVLSTNAYLSSVGRLPFSDGHSFDASSTLGWVHAVWLDTSTEGVLALLSMIEVNDDTVAAKIGNEIRDVSMMLEEESVDSHGNKFQDVITHIAATPYPVIDVQNNFEPLAFAKKQKREGKMGDKKSEATGMDISEMALSALGFATKQDADASKFGAAVVTMAKENTELKAKVEGFAKAQKQRDDAELEALLAATKKAAADNKRPDAFGPDQQKRIAALWSAGDKANAKEFCNLYAGLKNGVNSDATPAKGEETKKDETFELKVRSYTDEANGWTTAWASNGKSYTRTRRLADGSTKAETQKLEG